MSTSQSKKDLSLAMSTSEDKNNLVLAAQRCSIGEMKCECDSDMFQVLKAGDDGSDSKVICQLGMCHHYGWGTVQDLKAAVECYARAAALGSVESLERLKEMLNDQSVKTNLQNAFRCFCEKAYQGDARAQFNSGYCYFYGIGTLEDIMKAKDLFQMTADQGYADSMWMLDRCRQRKIGNGYSGMQKIALLKYAVEIGSIEAQYELGYAYFKGRTTYWLEVNKDHKQAFMWFQKAADQNHIMATNGLAGCYCNGYGVQKDFRKAFQLYKKAALMGNKYAQYHISDFYQYRMHGLAKNDYPVGIDHYEAAYWNQKAVDQDYDKAKKSMPDILKSIVLIRNQIGELKRQSSSFESAKTWYNIAQQYETGKRVKKDKKKAFQMYKLSARFGSTEGQVALARCYEQGIGTEDNILQSMYWNIRAAVQENTEAAQALQKWLQQNGNQSSFKLQESMLAQVIITLKQLDQEPNHHLDILLCIVDPKIKYQTTLILDFFNKGQDPPDNAKTFETCKLTVEYDMRAVYWMVRHYQHSANIANDFAGLLQRLQRETVLGKPETTYSIARCHMLELGIPKNEMKAVDFYKLAAEANHAPALHELGSCYQYGTVVERSIYKAIQLYRKAAEQQYIPALKTLADIYESENHQMKDLEQSFEYSKRAAQLGDADEQLRVAECYKDGICVERDDRESLCWFQKAANNGKYECYKYIAECHEKGIGTEIDQESAFEAYRRLATTIPTKENLIRLAERLENGVGTKQDATAAIQYYQQARAYSWLGDIYCDGNCVARNYETALSHYKRAQEFNLTQLLNVIRVFTTCQDLRGDGFFYFRILKLTALALRNEIFEIEIIAW